MLSLRMECPRQMSPTPERRVALGLLADATRDAECRVVAQRLSGLQKVVFSSTLGERPETTRDWWPRAWPPRYAG
jgi:hypothetical protein